MSPGFRHKNAALFERARADSGPGAEAPDGSRQAEAYAAAQEAQATDPSPVSNYDYYRERAATGTFAGAQASASYQQLASQGNSKPRVAQTFAGSALNLTAQASIIRDGHAIRWKQGLAGRLAQQDLQFRQLSGSAQPDGELPGALGREPRYAVSSLKATL